MHAPGPVLRFLSCRLNGCENEERKKGKRKRIETGADDDLIPWEMDALATTDLDSIKSRSEKTGRCLYRCGK